MKLKLPKRVSLQMSSRFLWAFLAAGHTSWNSHLEIQPSCCPCSCSFSQFWIRKHYRHLNGNVYVSASSPSPQYLLLHGEIDVAMVLSVPHPPWVNLVCLGTVPEPLRLILEAYLLLTRTYLLALLINIMNSSGCFTIPLWNHQQLKSLTTWFSKFQIIIMRLGMNAFVRTLSCVSTEEFTKMRMQTDVKNVEKLWRWSKIC